MALTSAIVPMLAMLLAAAALRVQVDKVSNNSVREWKEHPAGKAPDKPPTCGNGPHPEVPAELRSLGVQVFGSEANLKAFEANTIGPCLVKSGQNDLQFVSFARGQGRNYLMYTNQNGHHYDSEYGFNRVTEKTGTMVDLGAYIGDSAIDFFKLHPGFQIVAFEPVPPNYFYILWNMHLNGVPRLSEGDWGQPGKPGMLVMNNVAGHGEPVEIHYDANHDPLGGSKASDNPNVHESHTAKVPQVSLEKLFTDHGLQGITFAKMDCEGCEFDVVPSMRDWFSDKTKVKYFGMELHPKLSPSKEASEQTKQILQARGCGLPGTDEVSVAC